MNRLFYIVAGLMMTGMSSFARTIKVGKQQQARTIGQALSIASPGDTIRVESGIYREKNIVIDKPVVLLGIDYPVLDGEHKYEIISVKANNVTIKGFRIENTGVSSLEDIAAVKIYSCRNVTVSENIFKDTFFGIYSQSSANCLFENNKLTASAKTEQASGNGIHCWKSDSLRIIGNTITGHRDGVYFEFVTNSVIWRNDSHNNMRYGLHFMFSNNDAYISNIFRNNGAGVSVMFTHGVKMFNNYFEENWGDAAYGIFLKEISDSYIIGNKFLRNTSGIFMEGASRVRVEKNEFKDNGWAMKIQASSMDNVITNNNFLGNTFDVGTNGTLVMNTFDHNYWDKYEGYDLNRDNIGDVPFRPVSLYSMIVEKNPPAMMLYRSFMTTLLDKSEKILPTLTPENLKDNFPLMKPLHL
ncbi:MAG: nitrous oxide reductase family maturation protein NosD [Chitinophagales bacterium]|nr:nitrous oxide reductase family maturation protein NosD [Chitinophagales bacterium]